MFVFVCICLYLFVYVCICLYMFVYVYSVIYFIFQFYLLFNDKKNKVFFFVNHYNISKGVFK